MWETQVKFLGWEDPLEHDNLLQYSCLENTQKQMSLMGFSLLQEGGHLPGPESRLLSNTQK